MDTLDRISIIILAPRNLDSLPQRSDLFSIVKKSGAIPAVESGVANSPDRGLTGQFKNRL